MIELDDITREVLVEGLDDYVGIWEFAWLLRSRHPDISVDAVREAALDRISRLVEHGLMVPGRLLDEGGFDPWPSSPADCVERIRVEWGALGRDPEIGDICWLSSTSQGEIVARQISSDGGS